MTAFFRFLSIALAVYASVNAYILRRAFQGLAGLGWRGGLAWTFLFLWVLAFPAGRIAERALPGRASPGSSSWRVRSTSG